MSARNVWLVARPQVRNVVRSRWLICYFLFFLVLTEGLLRFAGGGSGALLSLSSVALFVVPLVTLVYGSIYLYNSREFIELLLAQPLRRRTVFSGLYAGLALPLVVSLLAGVLIPFLYHGFAEGQRLQLAILIAGTAALTATFTGIAFCVALRFDDKLTGLGAGLAIWLIFALVYDGALLYLVAASDEPLEKTLLVSSFANPIDLVRIAFLLQFDISALMGYTGAVFRRFFSTGTGNAVITAALAAWITLPLAGGYLAFRRKDL